MPLSYKKYNLINGLIHATEGPSEGFIAVSKAKKLLIKGLKNKKNSCFFFKKMKIQMLFLRLFFCDFFKTNRLVACIVL